MKNQKGITLIALVVTIIVILIIASVSIYTGTSAIQDSKDQANISEIKMLKQVILETYTKYMTTKDVNIIKGEPIYYADVQEVVNDINNDSDEIVTLKMFNYDSIYFSSEIPIYYFILNQDDLKQMGVTTSNNNIYIVNYYTGEVINKTVKVTDNGIPLYTYAVDVEIPQIIIMAEPSSNEEKVEKQNITIDVVSLNTISELKYKWTKLLNEPDKDQFIDNVPSSNNISTPSGESGNYYLWIYAKDVNGNEIISSFGGYKIGN